MSYIMKPNPNKTGYKYNRGDYISFSQHITFIMWNRFATIMKAAGQNYVPKTTGSVSPYLKRKPLWMNAEGLTKK